MHTSTITTKGQVTIPAELRRKLNLALGDRVRFERIDGAIRLVRREHRVEAAFGLIEADRSVSDAEMEQAIRARAGK